MVLIYVMLTLNYCEL